ncbi:MAG: glycosyltransferase family 4 protein [Planctomycetota bacterium]
MGCALRDLTEEPARPLRLAGQALAGIALGRTLLRRGIEHLHVHFAHAPATVGMYAAAYAGIPFSVTGHANDLYVHPQLLRAKLRRATPFATISEENRRFLLRELGAVAARVKLVRCGVDTERFQPHGARDDVPLVFSTGRLVPKKGLDLLLKSLARVVTPWRCVIAGDGPQHAELQRLARRLGIARRVRFLGAVDTATVRSYLRRAHVFVLPCRQAADGDIDGIPVALMEAMAMEVPVVSTRVSGIPELIEDRVSGRLVAPENTLELTYAISEILACSEHARSLGRAARAKVAAEFDLHRNARRLAGAFQTEARAASPLRIETRLGVASPNTPA